MKRVLNLGALALVLGWVFAAFAQEPESVEQAVGLLGPIWELIAKGEYLAAGAGITLILVFAFRKYALPKLKIGPGVLPLLAAGLGIVVGVAVSLYGGAKLDEAALAVLSGPAAMALWSALIKYFLPRPEEKA
jgi:hypothetical protein